jgi:hypothetical protein
MGRKAGLTPDQVAAIRASTKTLKELAVEYEVSTLTLGKVRRFQGAYKHGPRGVGVANPSGVTDGQEVLPFDETTEPVFVATGVMTNTVPAEGDGDEEVTFSIPIRHD